MVDKKIERRGLGRGLSALMADINTDAPDNGPETPPRRADTRLPIEMLEPNPDQPRRTFPREAMEELAASIREKGVIQPLIVRKNPRKTDGYEIVAGERRWRAAQLAKLHDVPVVIRELDDVEVLE
ncbi:MAG: ParB/RepB/Spo0J family partition protein, partial [Paracoccaceae bacterium]|nr:ParB/RepB/Spo0J family partition protein [Paracoccaceae bacterium]